MCSQWWRADDGTLCFCHLDRGHAPQCEDFAGRRFEQTVEMT